VEPTAVSPVVVGVIVVEAAKAQEEAAAE